MIYVHLWLTVEHLIRDGLLDHLFQNVSLVTFMK